MPILPSRPRRGRLLDVIVVSLLFFIFAGLAFYHYRRLDRSQVNPELAKELAEEVLDDPVGPTKDWPQWRGPNRDGVALDTPILADWPADGPTKRWEAKVGEGFASMAVARGRVFTIFQDGANESVVAWDAESGREIWRHSVAYAFKDDKGNGPRSTPSIDGELLYVIGANGNMRCLRAFTDQPHGELVWSKELLQEFAAPRPRWAVSFSPLVEGDRVFLMPGGRNGNGLAAIDKTSGATLWKTADDAASYSSPIAATFHDRRQILFLTGSRLVSVDPQTGQEIWDFAWPVDFDANVATPIVAKNYVFLSATYGRGCAMLKVVKTGEEWKANLVYKNRHMKNHFSTCVRVKNHIFGFDDVILKCMNLLTGEVVPGWEIRGFDKGSLVRVNDQLIIYGANGQLALAEANPKEYVERGRFQFSTQNSQCWSVPVVANGRLYVRDERKLVCFDVKASR